MVKSGRMWTTWLPTFVLQLPSLPIRCIFLKLNLRRVIIRWFCHSTMAALQTRPGRDHQLIFDLKHQYKQKLYTQQAVTVESITLHSSVSTSRFFPSFLLTPLPPHQTVQERMATSTPPTPTLAAIIRGDAVLSPVSSTPPWLSRASAGPCRPLSLTLTLPSLPGSTSLPLTPVCNPFRLPWPSGSCSCCPSIQPVTPSAPASSPDSRPSPRP